MDEKLQRKIFSKNLNSLLNSRGLTQKEVAETIGVSPQTFNTWCKGIALPRMGKVQLLADFFKISKSTLIENSKHKEDNDVLTLDEKELLKQYNSLNIDGQEKLLEYLNDLICLSKYKKRNSVLFDEKEIG